VAHDDLQAPAEHAYGAQVMPVPFPQVPDPLQTCVSATSPWQIALPQLVPEAHIWQLPAPSHSPSVPQVDAACIVHWALGSVPAATGPQVPSTPLPFLAAVHAVQVAVQAVLQQAPSTQKPDEHCDAIVQAEPLPSSDEEQTPAEQVSPGMQSALVTQGFVQAPPEHS